MELADEVRLRLLRRGTPRGLSSPLPEASCGCCTTLGGPTTPSTPITLLHTLDPANLYVSSGPSSIRSQRRIAPSCDDPATGSRLHAGVPVLLVEQRRQATDGDAEGNAGRHWPPPIAESAAGDSAGATERSSPASHWRPGIDLADMQDIERPGNSPARSGRLRPRLPSAATWFSGGLGFGNRGRRRNRLALQGRCRTNGTRERTHVGRPERSAHRPSIQRRRF